MTKRIAVAILLSVWATLIVTGIAAYLTTRSVLVATLDEALTSRAASLPEIVGEDGSRFVSARPLRSDDRFLVRNAIGQTVSRREEAGEGRAFAPQQLDGAFVRMPDGALSRRVTLRAFAKPAADGPISPVILTFTGSAAEFDRVTGRLGLTMAVCGAIGGVAVAMIAVRVARVALRPLSITAQTIAQIDDGALNRRIDAAALPAELLPVAHKLNDMLARLEEAFRRRKRFLADAAHELRTPVAAITTTLEVALRKPRDAQTYRQTLETSLIDARVLRGLVESLLTQARADLVVLDEPDEILDVNQLISQTVSALSDMAQERGVGLSAEIEQGRPLQIRSQVNRLRSVLINLIGNAIEHNREGGTVWVGTETVNADLRIIVRDTGPGIDARHLPHLFEPFYRVDGARRLDGHLGLGLFLVKTHVTSIGGEIRATSEPGEGTTFTVLLQGVRPEQNSNKSVAAKQAAAVDLRGSNIDLSRTFHAGSQG